MIGLIIPKFFRSMQRYTIFSNITKLTFIACLSTKIARRWRVWGWFWFRPGRPWGEGLFCLSGKFFLPQKKIQRRESTRKNDFEKTERSRPIRSTTQCGTPTARFRAGPKEGETQSGWGRKNIPSSVRTSFFCLFGRLGEITSNLMRIRKIFPLLQGFWREKFSNGHFW
jgi:hypothetical protein